MHLATVQTEAPTPLLIDQEEACRLLGGISRRMLLDLRKKSNLPAVPLGGRMMYDPVDLRKWIDDRKKPAHATLNIHQPPDAPAIAMTATG